MKTHITYHIEDKELVIDMLYVNPRSRGKRKGFELLNKARDYARKKGIETMSLFAYPQDLDTSEQFLLDYYRDWGFESDGDCDGLMTIKIY